MPTPSLDALRCLTGDWASLRPAAQGIRTEVFVHEQGIDPNEEWDEADALSVHCVVQLADEPVATGRLLPDGKIGRMAVRRAWRGRGLGALVLRRLLDAALARGDAETVLHAQSYACGFYERMGYVAEGEEFLEAGIAHRRMRRRVAAVRDESLTRVQVDGTALHTRRWTPELVAPGAPSVYVLHGLGEHSGRYEALARWFCDRGWTVGAHDHVGHGASAGRRGVLGETRQLEAHAAHLLRQFASERPLAPVLLGHSLGGALAASLALSGAELPMRGLVLSSPGLELGLTPGQQRLLRILLRWAPDLAVGNGLDARKLSHDREIVQAYRADRLVHTRISARLLQWLLEAGREARDRASSLSRPALVLWAGDDFLVRPQGARDFARAAAASAARVQAQEFPSLYHEIFNETRDARLEVLGALDQWLSRLPTG